MEKVIEKVEEKINKLNLSNVELLVVAKSLAEKREDYFALYFLNQLQDDTAKFEHVLQTAKVIIGKKPAKKSNKAKLTLEEFKEKIKLKN